MPIAAASTDTTLVLVLMAIASVFVLKIRYFYVMYGTDAVSCKIQYTVFGKKWADCTLDITLTSCDFLQAIARR